MRLLGLDLVNERLAQLCRVKPEFRGFVGGRGGMRTSRHMLILEMTVNLFPHCVLLDEVHHRVDFRRVLPALPVSYRP